MLLRPLLPVNLAPGSASLHPRLLPSFSSVLPSFGNSRRSVRSFLMGLYSRRGFFTLAIFCFVCIRLRCLNCTPPKSLLASTNCVRCVPPSVMVASWYGHPACSSVICRLRMFDNSFVNRSFPPPALWRTFYSLMSSCMSPSSPLLSFNSQFPLARHLASLLFSTESAP